MLPILKIFVLFVVPKSSWAFESSAVFEADQIYFRKLIGEADRHYLKPFSSAELKTMVRSHRARRTAAWQVAGQLISNLNTPYGEAPLWSTWNTVGEFQRGLGFLLESQNETQRQILAPFDPSQIDQLWRGELTRIEKLPSWDPSLFLNYQNQITQMDELLGLQSNSRVLFNPKSLEHYFNHYGKIYTCFLGSCILPQFGPQSIIVKPLWVRADAKITIPKTDHQSLEEIWNGPEMMWPTNREEIDWRGQKVISKLDPQGVRHQLLGLHVMTKQSQDWFWITLWWTPKNLAHKDFGADRPSKWSNSPWAQYKMCAVSGFNEEAQGTDVSDESLAQSLKSSIEHFPGEQWCSNPYLEQGKNNAATNCISCHQHAGTSLTQEAILSDTANLRSKTREDFPSDYNWSFNASPAELGLRIWETVDYYRGDKIREL